MTLRPAPSMCLVRTTAIAQHNPFGPSRIHDRPLEVPDRGQEFAHLARGHEVERVLLAFHTRRCARMTRRQRSAPQTASAQSPVRPTAGDPSLRSAGGWSVRNRGRDDAGQNDAGSRSAHGRSRPASPCRRPRRPDRGRAHRQPPASPQAYRSESGWIPCWSSQQPRALRAPVACRGGPARASAAAVARQ